MLETREILERLYRVRPREPTWKRRLKQAQAAIVEWYELHNWRLIIGVVAIVAWVVTHVYYYNQLVVLEYDCITAQAQIEASQQKRNHIQRNLSQLLRYYAKYERRLMTDITGLRAKDEKSAPAPAPAPAPGAGSLSALLGRLHAVAEQYPNLHLTKTAEHFSRTVVESEADIARQIMAYNNSVNRYTTVLSQFPGNVFGRALGFEAYEFYSPENPSILKYKELDL